MAKLLMHLPPEIIVHIFSYLDDDFFDVRGRLTLCRYWYSLARTVLFRQLRFSTGSLLEFHRVTEGEDVRAGIVRQVVSVDLQIHMGQHWQRPETRELMGRAWEESPSHPPTHDEQRAARRTWDDSVNSGLARLGEKLAHAGRLKSLTLRAHPDHWLRSRPEQFMPAEIAARSLLGLLLPLQHLRTLHLDLTSCYITQTDVSAENHYCAAIGTLLLTLESFTCRVSRFCEALLDPPAESKVQRLNSFTVYAGAFAEIKVFIPRRCQHVHGERRSELPAKMQAQADKLVKRMPVSPKPRQGCILTSGRRNAFINVYDAVTGRDRRVLSCEPLTADFQDWQ